MKHLKLKLTFLWKTYQKWKNLGKIDLKYQIFPRINQKLKKAKV
ncbi:Hypothetical Protein MfeM64YM_0884 [Mycoplasmopsis fermentans M64]|uniref:Uncharacterized protein n=1 Tax=Mycoplasmopsis fermentans (strain M64) TaxID=943945 RepID=A0AB32XCX1_MYCFM|nr:Hypothetical Protein MfeM64YM_0884 [Mycoplasmopsis fermentans M64]